MGMHPLFNSHISAHARCHTPNATCLHHLNTGHVLTNKTNFFFFFFFFFFSLSNQLLYARNSVPSFPGTTSTGTTACCRRPGRTPTTAAPMWTTAQGTTTQVPLHSTPLHSTSFPHVNSQPRHDDVTQKTQPSLSHPPKQPTHQPTHPTSTARHNGPRSRSADHFCPDTLNPSHSIKQHLPPPLSFHDRP